MTRKYKSGTRWCVWRWSDIGSDHIERLHIVKTPWFAVCLHWMNGPDSSPFEHDHPVSFLSIVLRGGYTETRNGELRERRWFNAIPAKQSDHHRIIAAKPNTVTLALMGPKVREWGFHTSKGWIGWREYYRQ
jgi:hypothetical protein